MATGEKATLIFNIVMLVFAVLVILNFIRSILKFIRVFVVVFTTKLTLEDGILTGKVGFIKTDRLNTRIVDVIDTRVKDGFWGKFFNYGRLIIKTVSSTYNYYYIKDANAVSRLFLKRGE